MLFAFFTEHPSIHVSLIQKQFVCRCLSEGDQVSIITTPGINRRLWERTITPQFLARQTPPEVGKMLKQCLHCCAFRFTSELTNCCHNGKVSLPNLKPFPSELKDLFSRKTAQSKNFVENIRKYDSAMAFASFGAKIATPAGYGPYYFKIHESIYHQTGSLFPSTGQTPSYSQLYIIEGDEAVKDRIKTHQNQNCRQVTMELLTKTLNTINPYAAAYRHMRDVYNATAAEAEENNCVPPQVTMYFRRGHDNRRYNEPTHDEVAVVFMNQNVEPPRPWHSCASQKWTTTKYCIYISQCRSHDISTFVSLWRIGMEAWIRTLWRTKDQQKKHNFTPTVLCLSTGC